MGGRPPSVMPQLHPAKTRRSLWRPPTPTPHRAGRGASGAQSTTTSIQREGPRNGRAGPARS
eukprot:6083741-Lingulodinium_polyedra.AAC.1